MNIIVTGGLGFIGSHIVDALVQRGDAVGIVDNLSTGSYGNRNAAAQLFMGDICNYDLAQAFEAIRPEVVIHEAAQTAVGVSVEDPTLDCESNIVGTIKLLECCKVYGVRKIIYASSAAIYGTPVRLPVDESHPIAPLSPYGISKYVPEHYLSVYRSLYGVDYTILRYGNVYGPRQRTKGEGAVIPAFFNAQLANQETVIHGDGGQIRDFIYVADVVGANLRAITHGGGGTFNVSCNRPITILELYHKIAALTGCTVPARHAASRAGDIRDSYLDNARLIDELGYTPTVDLDDGLRLTYEWNAQQ